MNKVDVIPAKVGKTINGKVIKRVAIYARVSTDSEEQETSYDTQINYYKQKYENDPNVELVGIFSDVESGGKTDNRLGFLEMIDKALDGEIDMIVTKSVSRFARNIYDTSKYLKMLKDINVDVFFDDIHAHSLSGEGDLVINLMGIIAEQELKNTSKNVKLAMKQKSKMGIITGNHKCFGYDYEKGTRKFTINEEQAKVVKYIFERYLSGVGCEVIAKELTALGYKTSKGSIEWQASGVRSIIRNEKYIGDVKTNKSYTLDPLSKRRMRNFGEVEQCIIHNVTPPIIDKDTFEKANELMDSKGINHRGNVEPGEPRPPRSKKEAFSCSLTCGFCGSILTRRVRYKGMPYERTVWECEEKTKHGKKECPNCKAISGEALEKAFVKSFNLLSENKETELNELTKILEKELNSTDLVKQVKQKNKEYKEKQNEKNRLIDLLLKNVINEDDYNIKRAELDKAIRELEKELSSLNKSEELRNNYKRSVDTFKKAIDTSEPLKKFDREVFENVIDKVIIGENKDGKIDPYKITFVYKAFDIEDNKNINDFVEVKDKTKGNNIATTDKQRMLRR